MLLKQGENVTQNVAALKAANLESTKVVEKHTEDTRSFIKVGPFSLYKTKNVSNWRNSK